MEALLIYPVAKLESIGIPPYVSLSWLVMAIILIVAVIVRSSMKMVPTGLQNLVEVVIEFHLDLAESTIGHMGRHFFPFIATIGIFILISNLLGLIPGFEAPTSNINTNLAMALPVFFATHIYGFKVHKFGYIKHFLGPIRSLAALPLMLLMFIIEVISHLARPVTLSVRLFGNMTGKHLILMILGMLVPAFIPITILLLGVLVSFIQTYIFILLTTLYLAGAVEEAH